MKKSKKILSLVLALVMLFSAVPATVFAAEPGTYAFTDSMTASLELESEVIMVVSPEMTVDGKALTAAEAEAVEGNVGILLWDAATAPAEAEATADTCENVVMGAEYNAVTGRFDVRTEGIAAKNLGDSLAVRSFYVDAEGNYTYGKYVASYSPKKYCYNQISGSDANLSAVCVALLNYGAAAQTYFRYNTENMMNAELTPAQQQVPWSSSLVRSVWGVAPAKEGALRRQNPPINSRGGSLELEGALNVVFTGGVDASIEVAKAQMLLWDEAAFNGMDVLTAESATEVVEMTLREDGKYEYVREDIPAKAMFDTIYACQMYTDVDGNVYYGGVLPFCAERYGFMKQFSEHDNLSAVTKAMIVYGDAARTYFSNQPGDDNQSGSDNLTAGVELNADGTVKEAVSMDNGEIGATVPAGVAADKTTLTLQVSEKASTDADVETDENETTLSLDVHVDGVAAGNTKAIIVKLGDILPKALNIGNVALYHVEGGVTNEMTRVMTMEELDEHNEYYYDPVTGEVYVAMASFSEITMVADKTAPWEGGYDYEWYNTTASQFTIANADQLAAFGKIVGGMAEGIERDTFAGKTVKLIANINLNDAEDSNSDKIFYPIGYYYNGDDAAPYSTVYNFKGVFDGNGLTISNFYQNTWEIKGDYDGNYYKDGMGLFGYVADGTVKNLTVSNFSSDGEFTPTGVIAAYADGNSTFENIAVINSNPRVYNTGNGGIIGVAGETESSETKGTVTLKNITVDQTNKISALWGSYDVGCGGLVGMFRGYSPIVFENCHVAAIMDVHNDVCANYQYYWYRYSGMLIGSVRRNAKDANGYTVAHTENIQVTDCTYTYGAWNEYWYCELVKNSLASYTHDHQFSRLTEISSLAEIKDAEGNWNKEGSFVIPNEDNTAASCYHIFKDSEGNLYQHKHDEPDESNPNIYETKDIDGNGQLDDLKEDRQCYYIPFGQVMNGNGYGVKPTYEFPGFEEVKDGTVLSSAKFAHKATAPKTIQPGAEIRIGDLFEAVCDESKLSKSSVFAAASPATEDDTVSATYSLDMSNWENSTLTFSADSNGIARIVITDYFYCEPTIIYLNVSSTQLPAEVKADLEEQGLSPKHAYIVTAKDFTVTANRTEVDLVDDTDAYMGKAARIIGDGYSAAGLNVGQCIGNMKIRFSETGDTLLTVPVYNSKLLNAGYQLYKAEDVVIPNAEKANMGYLYPMINDTGLWNLKIGGGLTGWLNSRKGHEVDIYVSFKVDGDFDWTAPWPTYSIAYIAFIESCENYIPADAEWMKISEATCTEPGLEGTYCPDCDWLYTRETELATDHLFTGEYVWNEETKTYSRTCANGCGTVGGTASKAFTGKLPAEVINDLKARGIGMKHVYDYPINDSTYKNASGTVVSFEADEKAHLGKTAVMNLANCGNPGGSVVALRFMGALIPFSGFEKDNNWHIYKWADHTCGSSFGNYVEFNAGTMTAVQYCYLRSKTIGDYNHLCDHTIDMYFSYKIDGPMVSSAPPKVYIDRVILVDLCENFIAEDATWTPVADATCAKGATESTACSECGGAYIREVGEPNGEHVFGAYELTAPATCSSNAIETAQCTNGCGTTDSREIPNTMTNHKMSYKWDKAAGAYVATCDCGESKTLTTLKTPLPQELLIELNASGIGLEHIIDLSAAKVMGPTYNENGKSGNNTGRAGCESSPWQIVDDVESPYGTAYRLDARDGSNAGKFIMDTAHFTKFSVGASGASFGTVPNADVVANSNAGYHLYKFSGTYPTSYSQYLSTINDSLRSYQLWYEANSFKGHDIDIYLSVKTEGRANDSSTPVNYPVWYVDRLIIVDKTAHANETEECLGYSGTNYTVTVNGQSQLVAEYAAFTLPECTETAPAGKQFAGWKIGDQIYQVGQRALISENVTATALWTDYVITFVNHRGRVIYTVGVNAGETPVFAGKTPVRLADAQHTYQFVGWDAELVPATANATYTTVFEAATRNYDITFKTEDGTTTLQTVSVPYGEMPEYTGTTPVKEGYTFVGWTPELKTVTTHATYKAVFQ